MKKHIKKFVCTKDMKEHYKNVHSWLLNNPTIKFKKLYPCGLEIDTRTVPENKIEEFLTIANSAQCDTK